MRLFLILFLLLPSFVFAGENCSSFNGTCREACLANEISEDRAFIDCSEKELCCVTQAEQKTAMVKCCVHSFDSQRFGSPNCSGPVEGKCKLGSGSSAECGLLAPCRGKGNK